MQEQESPQNRSQTLAQKIVGNAQMPIKEHLLLAPAAAYGWRGTAALYVETMIVGVQSGNNF